MSYSVWGPGGQRELEAVTSSSFSTFKEMLVPNIETLSLPVSYVLCVCFLISLGEVSDALSGLIISGLMFNKRVGIRHSSSHTHFGNLPVYIVI